MAAQLQCMGILPPPPHHVLLDIVVAAAVVVVVAAAAVVDVVVVVAAAAVTVVAVVVRLCYGMHGGTISEPFLVAPLKEYIPFIFKTVSTTK